MPLKRRTATQQSSTVTKPATAATRAQPAGPRFSPVRLFTRLIRIGICLFALYVLYQRYHAPRVSSPTPSQTPRPRGQYQAIERDEFRSTRILDALKHSYRAYERDAFGFDDYHPISKSGSNMSPTGPVGYFLVDSLDSLWIAGMHDEYQRARDWVENHLDLSVLDDKFHTFEASSHITIRVLGGLLSAYHLSGEQDSMLLEKATDLADRLLPAFETPSGLPLSFVNLARKKGLPDADNHGLISVAEAGSEQFHSTTLQLEFKYLSELTGDPVYWQVAEKAMRVIRQAPSKDGLVPIFMRPDTGHFIPSDIRLGSRGDSYYEYLLKQYLQTNKTEDVYRAMHDKGMGGIKKWLVKRSRGVGETSEGGLMFTAELQPRKNRLGEVEFVEVPKQDHLVCFLSASLLLGASTSPTLSRSLALPPLESEFDDREQDDWYIGKELLSTCVDTYTASKTGLAPEIVNFFTPYTPVRSVPAPGSPGRQWFINSRRLTAPDPPIDARNILRPETVESLFVAYRVTGDPIYREWGWTIFEAFERHCRVAAGGFASVLDVDELPVRHEDRMETFWISETLKYLLLLFAGPELLPLDQYVFNTEAHPLPIFEPTVVPLVS
ncbi:glycoside hydrolase family 47 protein [Sporobolomyces koalae]|uniref:glycoside hydrolase family 47 protein n=1 Tax=Sporobolomyces koalae TaxID=500713 RepID=UPI0031725F48